MSICFSSVQPYATELKKLSAAVSHRVLTMAQTIHRMVLPIFHAIANAANQLAQHNLTKVIGYSALAGALYASTVSLAINFCYCSLFGSVLLDTPIKGALVGTLAGAALKSASCAALQIAEN